jgi:hypothetical protein
MGAGAAATKTRSKAEAEYQQDSKGTSSQCEVVKPIKFENRRGGSDNVSRSHARTLEGVQGTKNSLLAILVPCSEPVAKKESSAGARGLSVTDEHTEAVEESFASGSRETVRLTRGSTRERADARRVEKR